MEKTLNPIGVFDSGVGGISVLKELVTLLPNEDFLYFGDSAHAPYGMKTTSEVRALTIEHIEHLLSEGAKAICVACNTATSAAVRDLRKMYPNLPLVGIEPALKPAASCMEHPKVLVMATPMTIREEKFQTLLQQYEADADIMQLPCPGLMEFIESGNYHTNEFREFLRQLLWDYENVCDAVVLGCTHYSFVRDQIRQVLGERTQIFDGALGTAKELKRRLTLADLLRTDNHKGTVIFQNSNPTEEKMALCHALLCS